MHDISLQPTTPDTNLTHDDEGMDPTHETGLDVQHNDTSTYSIYIKN